MNEASKNSSIAMLPWIGHSATQYRLSQFGQDYSSLAENSQS